MIASSGRGEILKTSKQHQRDDNLWVTVVSRVRLRVRLRLRLRVQTTYGSRSPLWRALLPEGKAALSVT
jgi:hypothetical protein